MRIPIIGHVRPSLVKIAAIGFAVAISAVVAEDIFDSTDVDGEAGL